MRPRPRNQAAPEPPLSLLLRANTVTPLDTKIYPPKLGKLRGRPKTKRIRKGAWNRQIRKCGNCGQTGHNSTGLPIAKNGRGERAREWNATEDDSSVGDSSVGDDSIGDVIVVDIDSR